MRLGARLVFGGALVIPALGAATPAFASFASIGPRDSGAQIQVSGGPGEANDLELTLVGTTYMITDTTGITAGPGCSGGGTVVTCPDPTGTVVRVVIAPADGADVAVLDAAIPSLMNGGPGRDRLVGGSLRDRILGRGDVDRLSGRGGDDRLIGDARGDLLNGGAGEDRLRGEQGTDRLRARDGQRDEVNGGPGRDKARADRKDRIRNVERVVL
jgi:Ca2+-binding RTX toxin-like protein